MSAAIIGAGLGAMAAGGVIVLRVRRNESRVADRVLPHVHTTGFDWSAPSAPATSVPAKYLNELLGAVVTDASVARRLVTAGSEQSLEEFRIDQLRWAAMAVVGVIGWGLLKAFAGDPLPPVLWLILCAFAAVGGALARDHMLTREANRRIETISQELPAFAELLAFTVAAGMAPASALNRIGSRVGGEFATEVRRCADQVAAGRPFTDALEDVAVRTGSEPVRRFVDGIIVAIERGTPIADVLRAQAMDARAASHRQLMESAGKREIFALIPVVFLILPAVVVVAVFPGFLGLVIN